MSLCALQLRALHPMAVLTLTGLDLALSPWNQSRPDTTAAMKATPTTRVSNTCKRLRLALQAPSRAEYINDAIKTEIAAND